MPQLAALLFAALCAFVIAFQIALLLGAPWGELSLGGRWKGQLPLPVRLLPLISILLLGGAAAIVLGHAGLGGPAPQAATSWGIWLVVLYSGLATVANSLTPSRRERRLWLPVALALLFSSLVVALA